MLVREMSRQDCHDLLTRRAFGRLACARDNQPYVVPVYFAPDRDHLYGFATMGRKIKWMRLNPLVGVEVDEIRARATGLVLCSAAVTRNSRKLRSIRTGDKKRNRCWRKERFGGKPDLP
jgi:hypothetical protein